MSPKSLTFKQQMSTNFLKSLETLAFKKNCSAGSILFLNGDKADHLYLLESGRLKVTKATPEGKELTLQIFDSGELLGVTGLFEQDLLFTSTGSMIDNGVVSVIPREGLERMLIKNGEFCAEFLRWMGLINRRMQSKFRDLLLNGKVGALYSTLIRMSNTYGKKQNDGILIDLSLTNRDLALFIGLTRESVNRMLGDLKKQEVIDLLPQGHILIKDLQFLKEAIFCDECPPDICQI